MVARKSIDTMIFISYSHKDLDWVERLRVHLKPLSTLYEVGIWDDTRIEPGSHWESDIISALDQAKIAILLVSADFLASDFITNNELPSLLKSAEERGTTIIPLIISPCRFKETRIISQFKTINDPSEPLTSMSKYEQERVLDRLRTRIENILVAPAEPDGLNKAKAQEDQGAESAPSEKQRPRKKSGRQRKPGAAPDSTGEKPGLLKTWVKAVIVLLALALIIGVAIIAIKSRRQDDQTASSAPNSGNPIRLKLKKNQSQNSIGDLNISLIDTQFDGESKTYMVTATISFPGLKPMGIEREAPALDRIYYYPDRKGYKIKVIESDNESATFQIE